jgi:hypothetical protein
MKRARSLEQKWTFVARLCFWYVTATLFVDTSLLSRSLGADLPPPPSCVVPFSKIDGAGGAGEISAILQVSGVGILVGAENGLYTVRSANGTARAEKVPAQLGSVRGLKRIPGLGILIGASEGLFLAKPENSSLSIMPIENLDPARVEEFYDLPQGTTLLHTERGWFFARPTQGVIDVQPVDDPGIGFAGVERKIPEAGVLFGTTDGWFFAHLAENTARIDTVGKSGTGYIQSIRMIDNNAFLIRAQYGWFTLFARDGGAFKMEQIDLTEMGRVQELQQLPGAGLLIRAANGLFLISSAQGTAKVERIGNISRASSMKLIPTSGILIGSEKGLFLAHSVSGLAKLDPIGGDNPGQVSELHSMPWGGILVKGTNGLFLATATDGIITLTRSSSGSAGDITRILDLPGDRLLFESANGLFLAYALAGERKLDVVHAEVSNIATFVVMGELKGAGFLMQSVNGWRFLNFNPPPQLSVTTEYDPAKVETAEIQAVRNIPNQSLLLGTNMGLLVVHPVGVGANVDPLAAPDTGELEEIYELERRPNWVIVKSIGC